MKIRLQLLATLCVALSALFGAAPARAAVSQLGAPAQVNNNSTLANFAIPAGTNRMLIVAASASSASGATDIIADVTYNGNPMTKAVQLADGTAAVDAIWYMQMGDGAASSPASVVVTASGTGATVTSIGAVVFQGVRQVTILEDFQQANGAGGASTLNVASKPGDLVFDLFDSFDSADTGTQTPGANQTVVHDVDAPSGGLHGFYKTTTKPGAAPTVPMTWTSSGQAYIHVAVNLYQSPVVVTGVTPNAGPLTGGPSVTITGAGFTGATAVSFGGAPANFHLDSPTQITATAPPHGPGSVSVKVTTPAGSGTGGVFTYGSGPAGGPPQPRYVEALEESNESVATATPLTLVNGLVKVTANLHPKGDVDYFSFQATAGDRVYLATMTAASPAPSSLNTDLTLIASNGTSVIEYDNEDGSFSSASSSIAGALIPATGTYFIKVSDPTSTPTVPTSVRPYDLYLQVRSGNPVPEVEPNDTSAAADVAGVNAQWLSGARNPAAATEQDWFPITLNAGDTVFLSLDLNPERDGTVWNGRLGFGLFGDANNNILPFDDNGLGDSAAPVQPIINPSEAAFITVKTAGTYYAFVDSATSSVGGPTATYHLNISVLPAINETWTPYASTNVPVAIGPSLGLFTSTITIPGHPRIAKIRVNINATHQLMADMDVHLRSPAGNDIALFTDIGATTAGTQTQMDLTISDDAATPPFINVVKNLMLKPEPAYRLGWFIGEDAGGTWTLDIRDDVANSSGGTLNSWSIELVEEPAPAPGQVLFATDFESGAVGFTHSGTADQWALGTPATVATTTANPVAGLNTANSGVNCWKTNLNGTYGFSCDQNLDSPTIDLTAYAGTNGRIRLDWAMWYQMENAYFDHAYVQIREVGGAGSTRKVWEFLDATMTDNVGNPSVNIPASSGWANRHADISDFAGKQIQVRFHVDSDTAVNMAGLAIDDFAVTLVGGASPEIILAGLGTEIVSGDTTPDVADGTDFGGTPVAGGIVAHTFTIGNGGNAPLNLTGNPKVAISGPGMADFTVTVQPTSPVGQNLNTQFEITFDPSTAGPKTATVTIANNDADEGSYTFAITGSGFNPPIVVDEPSDVDDGDTSPGHLSLREAIALAGTQAGDDTITLPAGIITLTSVLPAITGNVKIVGAAGGTTVSGAGQFQVFNVTGGSVTCDGLTIANGLGTPGATGGDGGTAGGIQIGGTANVTVTNCLFIGNVGGPGSSQNIDFNQGRGAGGGLQTNSSGTVTIRNSTFYGNVGGAGGGEGRGGAGAVQFENGLNYFESNTVAGNTGGGTAGSGGGGTGGAFTINQSPIVTNSLFADNIAGLGATFNGGVDFGGTMSSGGYNLLQSTVGTDTAALQPSDLQNVNAGLDQAGPRDHGGRTRTIRLSPNSKAIDAGKAPAGSSTDQRGQPRPVNLDDAVYPNAADGTDIGAYELPNAPIVVTSDSDTPAAGVLTLREAIAQAEAQPGEDNIVFNIPGAGVHTINLTSGLPGLTQPCTIDGYSQPGASANTLANGSNAVVLIELFEPGGGNLYAVNLLGTGSTVRGLALGNFNWGFQLGASATGNVISGNFIGLHADGTTPFNNNYGVVGFSSPGNVIGGTRPADRNVISKNNYSGVYLDGATAGTVVQGNYIGTNAAGNAALGNGFYGVNLVGATGVTVGGTTPGAGNLLSGNVFHGVALDTGATGNTIQGNRIGTDAAGTGIVPNQYGVVTFEAVGNLIGGTAPGEGNLITGNTQNGVYIGTAGKNNAVRGNEIYSNGGLGIQLFVDGEDPTSVTANDDGDADTGANNLQNFPVITSVSVNGGNTLISGTLNSTADTAFALDFFVNSFATVSGYGDGETYLGSATVFTFGNNGTFNVTLVGRTVPEETYLTATATDPDGNTSEFSLAVPYFTGTIQTGPNFVVNTTADSDGIPTTTECSLREAIKAANAFGAPCTITFDATVFAAAQTITLSKGEMLITNSMTITGPAAGVTVDGNGITDHILDLPDGAQPTVAVSGLTMTKATGRAIVNMDGSLTLTNCRVVQNGDGGIYNEGSLTLESCVVSDNTALDSGGGIENYGTLRISRSTIANNACENYGGGLYLNGGTLFLESSTVSNNLANADTVCGGGIDSNDSIIFAVNTTISGNRATGASDNCGGLWALGTRVTLKNCTITANTANMVSGSGSAGGVLSRPSVNGSQPFEVSNTIIAGNSGETADLLGSQGATFTSRGYNLIGDGTGATGLTQGANGDQVGTAANPIDPRLGPLANNGGPTQTHALLTVPIVSRAIDAGNSGLDTDQRGFARGFDNPAAANGTGNLSDIGAVEQDSTVTPVLQTGPNFVVNTTDDSDDLATTSNTSLREAIKAANTLPAGTATITFDPTVFATAKTITLSGTDLVILHAMTIIGPGADKLTISGNNQSRIFTVNTADGLNTISGLTVTGGNGTSSVLDGFGGGIINIGDLLLQDCTVTGNSGSSGGGVHSHNSATLTMRGCTVSNNTATELANNSRGGGVTNFQNATITNCTISGNHSNASGGDNAGGVWSALGALVLNNCTITGNTASGPLSAGGVRSETGGGSESFTVNNTIIAGNTGTNGANADVNDGNGVPSNGVPITSDGFNLIGDGTGSASFVNGSTGDQVGTTANPLDPRLGPLANNGGPTPTHALLAFSPAIDKGKVFGGLTTDQRGLTRPIDLPNGAYPNAAGGDASDIGALELQVEPPLPPYAGVDDAVAATRGGTRIYPLANDVSPSGLPLRLLSVSNPAITIDGRSLIIPAGFSGSFTYTFTDGTTVGTATVTVADGVEVTNARSYSGLLLAPDGSISGAVDATFAATGRVASVRMNAGTRTARFAVFFPAGSNVGNTFIGFGTLTLTRNMDGTVSAQFASAGDLIGGVLRPRKAPSVAGRYNAALASIDAAIPGGGYMFLNTLRSSAALLIGRLPDGRVFSTTTSLRDDGSLAFHSIVRRGVNPPELVGGELVFADLTATDLTGELAWAKPVQRPGVRGLHLGGVNTILTVKGCRFTPQPLPTETGDLKLAGGNLTVDEDTMVQVTLGRPKTPTGSLRSWLAYRNLGIFRAYVKLPGITRPVLGAGVYLPKSQSFWGFFPGTDEGGRIDLTPTH